MLYYNFQNYDGFKERFGFVEHGNGEKSRRNKVLLSFIKQPRLLREAHATVDDVYEAFKADFSLGKEDYEDIIHFCNRRCL